MGYEILVNIVADLIFLLLGILFAWIWLRLTNRRKLLRFFRVENSKRLTCYLSKLYVEPFNTRGIQGFKRSYSGNTVSHGEMIVANQVRELFKFLIPSLARASATIGRLLLSDVKVATEISPDSIDTIERNSSLISLGSPAYNLASEQIETYDFNRVTFSFNSASIADLLTPSPAPPPTGLYSDTNGSQFVTASGTANVYDVPDDIFATPEVHQIAEESKIIIQNEMEISSNTIGIVERLIDSENDRAIFYTAGLSELSTMGSVHYLVSEWLNLYKKFKDDKPFLCVVDIDPNDYTSYSVILETKLD